MSLYRVAIDWVGAPIISYVRADLSFTSEREEAAQYSHEGAVLVQRKFVASLGFPALVLIEEVVL